MVKIIFDGKIDKQDKLWVRRFMKDYKAESLTITLTDDWRHRVLTTKKSYKKYTITRSNSGIYYGRTNTGRLFGIGRKKNLNFPLIAVNLNKPMWKKTLLHEIGHWLQDTTEQPIQKYQRGKESYAQAFAEAEYKKIAQPHMTANLNDINSVMNAILPKTSEEERR